MIDLAAFVGRAPIVPAVDAEAQTVEIAGTTVWLNCCQFETFLALRPLTPVPARDLAELLHFPRRAGAAQTARYRIFALRQTLKAATGRDDLIETIPLGYRLVVAS